MLMWPLKFKLKLIKNKKIKIQFVSRILNSQHPHVADATILAGPDAAHFQYCGKSDRMAAL